jgi:DNA-binding ferritin-like protein (Dps family)
MEEHGGARRCAAGRLQVVYREMKQYMFTFISGDGMDVVAVLKDVLGLFETGAAEGMYVLDVTGEDVAAFCDESLRDTPSFADRWRTSLNRDVAKQLGHAGSQG